MALIDWIDPRHVVETGGIVLVLLIVFAESGLFFGFFLPGDSLLFTAGLLCGTSVFDFNILLLNALVFAAAVLGYMTGYYTGRKLSASRIFKEEKFLFRRSYMDKTSAFLTKYGLVSFVLARFIPLVRTYIPILAGTTQMDYRQFTRYNITGALIWVPSLIFSGYFLGKWHPQIIHSLGWIILGLILVTLLPFLKSLKRRKEDLVL